MEQPAIQGDNKTLQLLRMVSLLVAVLYIVFGFLLQRVLRVADPIPTSHRVVFSVLFAGSAGLSYISELARKHMALLTYALGCAAVLNVLLMGTQGEFDAGSVVALLLVIPIMNFLFYRWRFLLHANLFLLVVVVSVFAMSGRNPIDVSLFLLSSAAISGVSFWFTHRLSSAEVSSAANERMFQDLFRHSNESLSIHELVVDDTGEPIDYVFVDVNNTFEQYTGLTRAEVIGKRATNVQPGIEKSGFIEKYCDVVRNGIPVRFEQYSEALQRHYRVSAYPMGGSRFATAFEDITERRKMEQAVKESAYRFESLFNTMTSGVAIYQVLNDGASGKDYIVVDFNQSALRIENKDIAEVQGKSLYDLRPNIDKYGLIPLFQRVWKTGEPDHFPAKVYMDKEYHNWYENRVIKLPTGEIVAIYDDVTDKVLTAKNLEESEEKYRLLITQMTQGLAVYEQVFDGAGNVIDYCLIDANPAFECFVGLKREDILGKTAMSVLPKTGDCWTDVLKQVAMTGNPLFFEDYSKELDKHFEVAVYCFKPGQFAAMFNDITERKKNQQEIEYLSYHDGLTGLYNRRFFDEELKRLDVQRNLPLTVMMLDVNGLKLINDAFGHSAGDQLLTKVANTLQATCRADDIIARVGGDEFAILLPRTDETHAQKVTKRIQQAIASQETKDYPVSVSCGWGTKTDHSEQIADVFKTAEDFMYQRKISDRRSYRHQSISLIMQTLYAKSVREQQHSTRVSKLCSALGKAVGLDVDELTTAGLLHDIGKVTMAGEILDKKGPLTSLEWKEVKRHPEVGYSILSTVNDYALLAEYVLAHHERWDGTGYPRGLKGEAIPIQARIIGIADTYDAMTSDRAYREKASHKDAMEEVCRCSGSQFDPEVVKAFVEMMNNREA